MEYIICSAIYYNNGIKYPNQPKNISEGVVVCGFGHGDCISLLAQIFPDLSYKENYTEGFLTSVRRYVDRKEAGMLAIKSGQIKELKHFGGKELDSSDLYNSNPPIDNTLCVCDFPESGEHCTIHPVPDKVGWRKVVTDRIMHFQKLFHAHEAAKLTLALKFIDELIPPANWQSTQSDAVEFAKTMLEKLKNKNDKS